MKYAFYITNHGLGHASRNIPIIQELLASDPNGQIYVKTDYERCQFIERNLRIQKNKVLYFDDCSEVGLVLKKGTMSPDIETMKQKLQEDLSNWEGYIKREICFLKKYRPDIVISDVVPWVLKAAKNCGTRSILIGNFNWSEMYKSFYSEEIWQPYSECYKLADKAVWYQFHTEELEGYCSNYECVSLISRSVNYKEVERIKNNFGKELIFVSLGGSAEISDSIYVGHLPYDFVVTKGIQLEGVNVHVLPEDLTNTPDYIAASKYIIAKGGWSTISEILLQKKKCALLFRGSNSEDDNTKRILESKRQCVCVTGKELKDMGNVINKIANLKPDSYEDYRNDTERVRKIVQSEISNKNCGGEGNDTI